MFQTLHVFKDIGQWLWSNPYIHTPNNTAPVASLIASIVRSSFELRTGPESQREDSLWLEYLSSPENRSTIVSTFIFQGTTDTPASVEKVRDDLLFFFSSQSKDCDTLQKCRTSLESHLEDFVHPDWRDSYGANMKEARKVIDKLISKQSRKLPANTFSRLLRRSKKSVADPEARD
ncbi:hypothetical protein BDZ89DRAFT_1146161 [Hymenopellis radicata]|nr:hypothetical protein BDZ89DRAFT_1146161 [Hymenopellis radicata]